MRAALLLLIFVNAFASYSAKLGNWWLSADSAYLTPDQQTLTKASISHCQSNKPFWQINAKAITVLPNKLLLDQPSLQVMGFSMPLLYHELPLDGSGKSGFLAPSFSSDKYSGHKLSLPFYLWGDKFHITRFKAIFSEKLGGLFSWQQRLQLPQIILGNWLAIAQQGHAWRLQALAKNLTLDWADTDSADFYWLWQLKELAVTQARIERFFKYEINTNLGKFFLEIFNPKSMRSQFDTTLASDYAWSPRLTWQSGQAITNGWLQQSLEWTRFRLRDQLSGDSRPETVTRLSLQTELNQILKLSELELSAKLQLHGVNDNYNEKQAQAIIPVGLLALTKNYPDLSAKLQLRLAPYVQQDALPILDSELIDLNINSWDSGQYFAGSDRVSDINSIAASIIMHQDNWQTLFGIRHDSQSQVCLENNCNQPANNLFAFGFNLQPIESFVVFDRTGLSYLSAAFSKQLPATALTLGYRQTQLVPKHIFINVKQKITPDTAFELEHNWLNSQNQQQQTKLSFTKNLGCAKLAAYLLHEARATDSLVNWGLTFSIF